MKKTITILSICAVALGAGAHEWTGTGPDYSFGTPESPLASGTLSAPANVQIRSLSVSPAADAVVTVGGGPLALQSGAVVSNASSVGEIVLAAAATGTDGLRFGALVPATFSATDLHFNKSDRTVATGMTLDDLDIVSAVSCGKDIGEIEMLPRCVQRTAGSCTVQFQCRSGEWIKCVKLILSQSGADIVGWAVYARYMRYNYGVGHDFDTNYAGETSVAYDNSSYGYGVQAITFRPRLAATGVTRVTGDVEAGGPVVVDPLASVVFSGSASGLLASNVQVNGSLTVGDMTVGDVRTFTNAVSGTAGTLTFGPSARAASDDVVVTDPVASTDTSAKLISTSLRLENVQGFTNITISGKSGQAFFPTWQDGKLTVQFQGFTPQKNGNYEGYVMCAVMTFAQTDGGLTATRGSKTYYLWGNASDVGTDLTAHYSGSNGAYSLNGYTVVSVGQSVVNLTGTDTLQDGTVVVASNTLVRVKATDALPAKSGTGVDVLEGGVLDINVGGGARGLYPIRVRKGGLLRASSAAEIFSYSYNSSGSDEGESTAVVLEGGTLELARCGSIADDSGTYLNRLQLQDGARLTGYKVRVGYPSSTWYVRGTSPSYFESGFLLVGMKNKYTLTLDVADVTGDDGTDLYQTGALRDFGQVSQTAAQDTNYGIVCKKGAGTWLLDSECPVFCGEIRVEAGTLCLGRSNVLPDLGRYATASIPAFNLKGGALAVRPGTENAISNLTLQADSSIALASGATLAFGDSSAQAWTAGKRLTVTGLESGALRFGTSAAGLTASQVNAIRVLRDGRLHRVVLDETGYLRQRRNSGFAIMFR